MRRIPARVLHARPANGRRRRRSRCALAPRPLVRFRCVQRCRQRRRSRRAGGPLKTPRVLRRRIRPRHPRAGDRGRFVADTGRRARRWRRESCLSARMDRHRMPFGGRSAAGSFARDVPADPIGQGFPLRGATPYAWKWCRLETWLCRRATPCSLCAPAACSLGNRHIWRRPRSRRTCRSSLFGSG